MTQQNGNPAASGMAGGAGNASAGSDLVTNSNLVGSNNQGIVGRKFGHWTVVQADATAKRVHAKCVCGRVRYLGFDLLLLGYIDSCGCRPPTPLDREAYRIERKRAAVRRAGAS